MERAVHNRVGEENTLTRIAAPGFALTVSAGMVSVSVPTSRWSLAADRRERTYERTVVAHSTHGNKEVLFFISRNASNPHTGRRTGPGLSAFSGAGL